MTAVRPYGDTTDDGRVQLSFTLPVDDDTRGRAAAEALAAAMGVHPAFVAHHEAVAPGYTFYVVFGSVTHQVDLETLDLPQRAWELLSQPEVDRIVLEVLKRRCRLVGANIETDAHTVGLDAILNVKGFAGDKGLEHYRGFEVHNLGAQVDSQELVRRTAELDADALLVSQVVTERDAHRHHLGRLVGLLTEARLRERLIVVAGGPRLTPDLADELGLDAVFGRGTVPSEVASYLAHELRRRHQVDPEESP